MPKTSTKKNNKSANAMNNQTKKVASVDKSQRSNNNNNKADKTLPCTNSSEHADDVPYNTTTAELGKGSNKKNYSSKTDSKYKFDYFGKNSNTEDISNSTYQNGNYDVDVNYDVDDDEEEMEAGQFEIPHAKNRNKMYSSSNSSSLPFDLHGAERLRREFLFSFGRLNQYKRSIRTHANQGFTSNSGNTTKFNVNNDMNNDINDEEEEENIVHNTQQRKRHNQQQNVTSKSNEENNEVDEDEDEDEDEELNEYDDNVRHIAALRGMLTDEELFRAFFEPLSYTFDSGSRDDSAGEYNQINSNWQRRRMEHNNNINDRFHRVEVIDDNEEEGEDDDEIDDEDEENKNTLPSHTRSTSCHQEDNTITFSSSTCFDDSNNCYSSNNNNNKRNISTASIKTDNVIHSTESVNSTTIINSAGNENNVHKNSNKFTDKQSVHSSKRNAIDKSSIKALSHWSEAQEQEEEKEEEQLESIGQDEESTTKSKTKSGCLDSNNNKVKCKIKEILTLEDVLRCTSLEYNEGNSNNDKEKNNTTRSNRSKELKNVNKLKGVETGNCTAEEDETNNDKNSDSKEDQSDDYRPIDLSSIDLDDEGSMYVMQRLLDFLQQTMDNSERDVGKEEDEVEDDNIDKGKNDKVKYTYKNTDINDKVMCDKGYPNIDKDSENYHSHRKRSYYKSHPLKNEGTNTPGQINTNEDHDEDEDNENGDEGEDDVNDIYFSSLGLHSKRRIRSNPWESQHTLNSPLDKKVHFTYQTNTTKRSNINLNDDDDDDDDVEEQDDTDFNIEEINNIEHVNSSSNTNKGRNNSNKRSCASAAESEDMRALLSAIRHRHYTSFTNKSNDGFDCDDKTNSTNDVITANTNVKSKSDVKNSQEAEATTTVATIKAKVSSLSSSSPLSNENNSLITDIPLLSGTSRTNSTQGSKVKRVNDSTSDQNTQITTRQNSKTKFSGEQYFCLRNEAAMNPSSSTSVDFNNDKRKVTTTTKTCFTPTALPEDWTAQLASYFADDSFTVASTSANPALDVLMNEYPERSTRHNKSKKQSKECKSSVFDIMSMNTACTNTITNSNSSRERSLENNKEETNAAHDTQEIENNTDQTKCQTSIKNENESHDNSEKMQNEHNNNDENNNNNNEQDEEMATSEPNNPFRVRKRGRSTMLLQQRTLSELREKMSILSLFSKETLQNLAREVHKVELPRDLLLNFMPLPLEDSSVAMVGYRLCEAGKAVAASLWWYKEVKSIMTPSSLSKSSLETQNVNSVTQANTSLASSPTRLTEEKRLELQSILHVNYNKLHSALRLLSNDGLKSIVSLLPQLGLITSEDVYGVVNTIATILFFNTLPLPLLHEICDELAISTSDEANMDVHVLPETLAEKIGNYLYPTPERVRIVISQLPFLPKLQIHESGNSYLCTIDNASNLCRLPTEHYLSNRFNCTEESSLKMHSHYNGNDETKNKNKGVKIK